jgi:probable F420-dependent oxidoreductase
VEIGLHLPSAQSGANASDVLTVARTAERAGFDAVWMFDHLFTPTDLGSRYPYSRDGSYPLSPQDPFFDPLAVFGVLAGATERLKLGTMVLIAAYRHPIVLAKALASIENFAPGRVVLGVGAGWMREEFDALGVSSARRGDRLVEYVRALRTIWSPEPVTFEGEFYSFPEAGFLPAPTAPIPVIFGGHSDGALRRAAQHGDGWAIATARGQGSGIDAVARRIEVLKGFLDEAGRDTGDFHLVYQSALWFSDHTNDKLPLTGPPHEIAASLGRLADLGVTMVDLMVFGPGDVIASTSERFAAAVRPLL